MPQAASCLKAWMQAATVVVQTVLPGGVATYDTDGGDPVKTAVQFTGQSAASLSFLQCYDPTGVFYDSTTGQIIPGGKITVSGQGQVQVYHDGATGRYCFCASTRAITPSAPHRLRDMLWTPRALPSAARGRGARRVRWSASAAEKAAPMPASCKAAAAAANPWYRVLHLSPAWLAQWETTSRSSARLRTPLLSGRRRIRWRVATRSLTTPMPTSMTT